MLLKQKESLFFLLDSYAEQFEPENWDNDGKPRYSHIYQVNKLMEKIYDLELYNADFIKEYNALYEEVLHIINIKHADTTS